MLFKEYHPKTSDNRLKDVTDVAKSRKFYYQNNSAKPENNLTNLRFLLKKRYQWMNNYIKPGDKVLELGCGIGVSKDFIRKDAQLILTDVDKHPWVDQVADALDTKFPDKSINVVFCSNVVHHLAFPMKFFKEVNRILKSDGYLLIQEGNCSLMTKIMLRLLRHEGWSYQKDPFNLYKSCNDESDPWSGNNAVPNLLFDNQKRFEEKVPFFKIKKQKFSEFFIFPLSGGVTAKAKTINLPWKILKLVDIFDTALVSVSPKIFALQRRIILKKE